MHLLIILFVQFSSKRIYYDMCSKKQSVLNNLHREKIMLCAGAMSVHGTTYRMMQSSLLCLRGGARIACRRLPLSANSFMGSR